LNRLVENEEGEKKKKGLVLKANIKESKSEYNDNLDENDEGMRKMVRKFKKYMRHKC